MTKTLNFEKKIQEWSWFVKTFVRIGPKSFLNVRIAQH